jgi:putative acetyltransferase
VNERSYEPSDLEQVIAVSGASIHSLAAPFYTAAQLAAWAPQNPDVGWWQQRLAPLHTVVAERDGVIAGFASSALNGHLDLLYTHPAFARQGVATRLYGRVESALRAAAVWTVFTEASLAARPFFERCGFKVDLEEIVECRGTQLRRYAMHKQIRADPLKIENWQLKISN